IQGFAVKTLTIPLAQFPPSLPLSLRLNQALKYGKRPCKAPLESVFLQEQIFWVYKFSS
ncbi:Hypothetical predicted protein, partial [Olea europaea subsp. europaea]